MSPNFPANSHIRFARALLNFCTAEVVATKKKKSKTRSERGNATRGRLERNGEKKTGTEKRCGEVGNVRSRARLNIERTSGAGERALEESKEAAKQKF